MTPHNSRASKRHLYALPTIQPSPRLSASRLLARHQELRDQLQQISDLWQQADTACQHECEKPELERDAESLASMREAQARMEVLAAKIMRELKDLDAHLAPYLAEVQKEEAE